MKSGDTNKKIKKKIHYTYPFKKKICNRKEIVKKKKYPGLQAAVSSAELWHYVCISDSTMVSHILGLKDRPDIYDGYCFHIALHCTQKNQMRKGHY